MIANGVELVALAAYTVSNRVYDRLADHEQDSFSHQDLDRLTLRLMRSVNVGGTAEAVTESLRLVETMVVTEVRKRLREAEDRE